MLELPKGDWCLKRILTFAQSGGNPQTKNLYVRLATALQKKQNIYTSRKALVEAFLLVSRLKEKSGDIWQSTNALEAFVDVLESNPKPFIPSCSYPPDKRFLDLPVFQKRNGVRTEDDVTGSFEVTLSEGRIYELQNKHIALVTGGPSRSGKSTLAVSLMGEMKKCIKSLNTRGNFSDLEVTVGLANLDLATPTTLAIEEGWATDHERVKSLKRPWTIELAEEAQKNLLSCRAKYNITIGDLPGGRIDDITELLAATADASIIISNDWETLKKDWCPLMKSVGIPIVSLIRSRSAGDGVSSLVTQRIEGEILMGRISSLNRQQKSWDLFIQWLALFLLFDVLPAKFKAGS